ncbi:hypothetical protein D9757_008734 [Collybiopsis confluens]|uniref:Phosphatidylserine decarboxylase proenzyme 2 n=1 Tax=Collybiopsis confluens TaxID=2823264 RepID=A0A8H5H8J8_9AGAR|nr:hypothetical protein D9757_008734 [Collybiopsis confluens]
MFTLLHAFHTLSSLTASIIRRALSIRFPSHVSSDSALTSPFSSLAIFNQTEGVGTVRSHVRNPEHSATGPIDLTRLDPSADLNDSKLNGLLAIPATAKGYQEGYPYEDDGGLSSSDELELEGEEEEEDEEGERVGGLESDSEVEVESPLGSDVSESEREESHSESEDTSEYESESESDVGEEEDDNVRTPTITPLVSPSLSSSPMTTPTVPAKGIRKDPPTSFASLYEGNAPLKSAPATTAHFDIAGPSPTGPALSASGPGRTIVGEQHVSRKPPLPSLNLTPASPVSPAKTIVPNGLGSTKGVKEESLTPTSATGATVGTTTPVTSSPTRRFRLTPMRAATYDASFIPPFRSSSGSAQATSKAPASPVATRSPGLSSVSNMLHQIPRIPKPRFVGKRSASTANVVSLASPSSPSPSSAEPRDSPIVDVYDLTEDIPKFPASTSSQTPQGSGTLDSGNMSDPSDQRKEKKSRFRKSWSGVKGRRSSFDSPTSPVRTNYESSPEASAIAAVNMDAASQAAGKVKKTKVKKARTKKTRAKKDNEDAGEKTKKGRKFRKSSAPGAPMSLPGTPSTATPKRKRPAYSFGGGESNDIVGIVMLEIEKAEDLPKLKNITRTGWDMDPFVVISFGKKVFRTRVIRHSLNPSWEEKLLFHVRRYETGFKVQLTVLDWDKLSSNDYIGECDFNVSELIAAFEDGRGMVDPETGLYPLDEEASKGTGTKAFRLPLKTPKGMPWEAKHRPYVTFRGKYQPYAALRQRFWLQYLKQYDTDDTGSLSHLEITSMLDSLGSTLSNSTVNSFFIRFGKNPLAEGGGDELTMAEAIQCLEEELGRGERGRALSESASGSGDYASGADVFPSVSATPVMMIADRRGQELSLEQLDFSGPPLSTMINPGISGEEFAITDRIPAPKAQGTDGGAQQPLTVVAAETASSSSSSASTPQREYDHYYGGSSSSYASSDADADVDEPTLKFAAGLSVASSAPPPKLSIQTPAPSQSSVKFALAPPPPYPSAPSLAYSRSNNTSSSSSTPLLSPGLTSLAPSYSSQDFPLERVINVQTCPLCHRPRLNSKAEVDIVTHLAICASQDWNKVDRIMVGNFVTASQAQRKWYTRIIGKMSSGNYKLGANSANIIVQNRSSGQLEEEKMQVYVRLGIRLLYKGMKSRMEGTRARRLLKSLSIKQGIKFDSPESVRDILPFIEFHKLDMSEVRDPLESFKTFNQFFYRKLKPDARPLGSPSDPYRLVSVADCRFMAFESVNEATRLWIKGREFSVARLLGNAYKAEADRYNGGALAIFRLAPQDYHRFHSPVDGTIGKMTYIAGEYYTVNPQAIRTALDVYGENARKIVPIDSPQFGRVMAVCVGAMMVGTIQTTVEEGQFVKRGEEFGFFAFGGSTIVLLFEPGMVEWDEDLLINGRAALETLVRVGMGIGTGPRKGQVVPKSISSSQTNAQNTQ